MTITKLSYNIIEETKPVIKVQHYIIEHPFAFSSLKNSKGIKGVDWN
jgi:hypothetical protein